MVDAHRVSRRSFIRRAGAAGLAVPYLVPAGVLGQAGRPGANDKIGLGLIGCGGMGRANLDACAQRSDVVVVGACDVWKSRREAVVAQYQATAKPYHDYREMLRARDVDAVIIATPPHWHCRIAVDACEAGKDLYLQKPMTVHAGESFAVRNAVRRHKRICQIGTQIHASENYRRVVEFIRAGKLGPISVARTFNVMNQGPGGIGNPPTSAPPAEIDWDFWIGPAPMQPFNPLIVSDAYHNCSFMASSGGWTPGMAPHIIDLPVWALDLGYPQSTYCSGGRYVIKDIGDAPDVQEVLWQYGNFTLTWMMSLVNSFAFDFGRGTPARRLGIYFHGLNGTLYSDYGTHEIVPEGDMLKDAKPPEKSIAPSPGHEQEWLDSIRTRVPPSCNPDYHCRIDVPICLANLSMKLGRAIRFDPTRERILDDEAARLAVPQYRAPWEFPRQYL
ncbi:MAG: Gfo/Idh/MocA family oxidoreductase [Phycisphaerae bacterium]|nr:Gfo/Idh/MocA family oxidoreductase [Phycisphaerae bacterium]